MKHIPLAKLKNTTGSVAFCKEANEIVVANRNDLPKLVLISKEVYENGLGKVMDYESYRMRKDYLISLLKDADNNEN